MKILVLGTSNSLRKGSWLEGVKKAVPAAEIENRSIGGSPGIQFAALTNLDYAQYDYVFFDSVPNDEEYECIRGSYSSCEYLNGVLFELLSTINLYSNLIILGIPLVTNLGQSTIVMKSRRHLAKLLGAQFIDVERFLSLICSFVGVEIKASYENLQHPIPFLLTELGVALGEVLIKNPNIKKAANIEDHSSKYSVEAAAFIENAERLEVSNSILKETFYIPQEREISIPEQLQKRRCLGFYANFHHCRSYLKVTSTDGHLTFINMNYKIGIEGKILKVFVPIPEGKKIKSIEILNSHDGNLHAPLMMNWPVEFIAEPRIAISNFVFRNDEKLNNLDSISHDIFHNERETQEALENHYLSSRLAKLPPQVRGAIKSRHDTCMYWDEEGNYSIFLNERLSSIYPRPLLPVRLELSGESEVRFYCETKKTKLYLSLYDFGAAVDPEFFFDKIAFDKSRLGSKVNSPMHVENHNNGYFSLKNREKYLRVTDNFTSGFRFDRDVRASAWEMLEMADR